MADQVIPRIIHYCWFGGQKIPSKISKRVSKWNKVLAGQYQIKCWDEQTYDLSKCPSYVRQAYEAKKWAFVSDYVRIDVLIRYGGIYLDTDVDLLKGFDAYLSLPAFVSHESDISFCTAIIGCAPGNPLFRDFLRTYESEQFVFSKDIIANSERLKTFVGKRYPDSPLLFNQEYRFDDLAIFPRTIFGAKNIYTYRLDNSKETVAIHQMDATWFSPFHKCLRFVKKIVRGFINTFKKGKP